MVILLAVVMPTGAMSAQASGHVNRHGRGRPRPDTEGMPAKATRAAYCRDSGIGYIMPLTRPRSRGGTLSHRMGEGWGEGKRAAHCAVRTVNRLTSPASRARGGI